MNSADQRLVVRDAGAAAAPVAPIELEALGEQIAELAAHLEAATYRQLCLIREFDAREGWAREGARSCAHWLAWRVGIGAVAAREKVRVARALEGLPLVSEALRCGEISYAKARAITRVATPETEDALLTYARHGTAAQLEQIIRSYRRVSLAQAQAQRDACGLYTHFDEDGMLVVRGRLTPEQGAALLRALELAQDQLLRTATRGAEDVSAEAAAAESTGAQRQAEALGLVAQSALDHGLQRGTAADRTQVVLHVDAAALADPQAPGQCGFGGGGDVSAEAARRLACDAAVVAMTHGADGGALDVGRMRRTVPPAIRRALAARDASCRFPGCTHTRFLDAHHVQHWVDGGATRIENLVLLCDFHHRLVHENGFGVEVSPGGAPIFTRPDGTALPAAPARRAPTGDGLAALRARNRAAGLRIDARRLTTWDGIPADHGLAVDLLVRAGGRRACDVRARGLTPDVNAPC